MKKGSWFVWPELKKEISVEQESLKRLLCMHQPLIEKCRSVPPAPIELSELSAMLHSFYTGIENLFKRVAVQIDGGPPDGDLWHSRLLEAMTKPAVSRPALIFETLRDTLRSYLSFRHVFRHAYSFELQRTKMADLVLGVDRTLERLEEELAVFAAQMARRSAAGPPSAQ